MSLGNFNVDDLLTFTANTHDPSTGGAADVDSAGVPAYRVYEDETGTAILTGSMAKLDDANTLGFYSEQLTLSAANGFEVGKSYSIYISATVGAVAGTKSEHFTVGIRTDVGAWLGTAVTTSSTTAKPEVDAFSISNDATAANNAELAFDGTGFGFTGCTMPTVTTLTGHTVQTGDSFARLGAPAGASISADIADVPTVAEFNARTLVAASYFDPAADTVANVTTVATLTGHIAQTGDNFARLGAPAGASVSADIAAVKVDTAKLGTVTDLGGGATIAANLSDMAGATFSTVTDTLEAIRDRGDAEWTTGAGGSDRLLMVDTTIATLSSQTSFTLASGSTDDGAYEGCTIVIEDVSTATQKAIGIIDVYTGSTKTVTLLEDPGVFTMAATDKVYVLAEKGLKPTTSTNYHVDVSANGNVGIDWGNVDNPATAVDLSGTDIQLCDTITTYTGNIVQTGDSFARLGAPAGASVSADIADVPTVAEFNARTLVAASYFDPAADTVANVTTVATLTGHIAQTGDSFARLGAPAGASVSADVAAVKAETALIVADTNELQTDWADAGRLDVILDATATAAALATVDANVDLILADTGTDGVVVGAASKTGYALSATGLDATTLPANIITATSITASALDGKGDWGTATALATVDTVVDAIKVITDALGATAAANLNLSANQIIPFTVDTVTNTHTPTTTEFQADDVTEATADHFNGRIIVWTTGVLAGQATSISDYAAVGGIGQFTVVAMTEAPANNDTGIIL